MLEADSRFAGRLRALEHRGELADLEMTAIKRATERFNIRERLVRNDTLGFVRACSIERHQTVSLTDK